MPPLDMDRCILCLLACVALGACSGFEIGGKKIDYKSAGQTPPLEVPPDLTRPGTDDRFTVPDANPASTATFSEYSRERVGQARAGVPGVLPEIPDARVVRDGSQRWLVVTGTPEQVWPKVKDFWQEAGFIVNVEIPEAGVMETDWAEKRAKIDDGAIRNFLSRLLDTVYSTGERDKYRTRLERGAQPGTTEIYISHRGMEEVYTSNVTADRADTRWQPRPPDPGLEAEMLRRLMVRFGVEESRARSQVASAQPAALRATLSRVGDGTGTLAVNEQFDRAWRRVGLALDRVGFTVEDSDRSKGLYFVRYIDPQTDNKTADQGGFWSKLKFWSSDKPKPNEQFRIHVKAVEAAGCQVNVFNKDGTPGQSDTAGRILTLLYEQLK
ncbi:MAG: outer membrane protein assembly factor BamC [Burkholderiales bacterium]